MHIYGRVSSTEYQMILATGLKAVTLDKPLDSKNGADTDKDTITNWNEVDIKSNLIKFDSKGNIIVPTFGECIANEKLLYVEEGLKRFKGNGSENFNEIYNNIRVLPIVSDPTSKDGDGDGYLDLVNDDSKEDEKYAKITDPHPLCSDIKQIKIKNEDYVPIEKDGEIWYGGNQSWISEEHDTPDYFDFLHITNSGCGITATVDFIIYMALYNSNYTVTIPFGLNSNNNINYSDYEKLYLDISESYIKLKDEDHGTTVVQRNTAIIKYFKDNSKEKISFINYDRKNNKNKKSIQNVIKSLRSDIPVELSVVVNGNYKESVNRVQYYSYDNTKFSNVGKKSDQTFGCHSMRITGLIIDTAANETPIYYYIVSSWGFKFTVKEQDVFEKCTEDSAQYKITIMKG